MKTKNFLSMAALALVGAVMMSCSSEDELQAQAPQQPENNNKAVTLTTTISLSEGATDGASRRALAADGTKTFAVGEQVALSYWRTDISQWDKALSQALTVDDISADGKSAKLTFTLTSPEANGAIRYVYPAAMADSYGQVDYSNLSTQDGTLATLSSSLDLAVYEGNLVGTELPANITLTNQLAILAITLKDIDGSNNITGDITGLTLNDGTNSYTVTRSAAAGPIYVAIQPTSDATIWINATADSKKYVKTLTKTYESGNGYSVSWRMATIGDVILSDGKFAKAGTDGAIALITYVGNDAETDATYKHGLALALKNANSSIKWCFYDNADCPGTAYEDASHDMAGIANTDALVASSHSHQAANAARNFKYNDVVASGTHPSSTSAWFLPTVGQWKKMINACKNVLGTNNNYTDLRDAFSTRGGTNIGTGEYWSSNERTKMYAWAFDFNHGSWSSDNKTTYGAVRAAIAF